MSSTFQLAQEVGGAVTEASGAAGSAWLLIAFPVIGAVVLLLGGKATNAWGHLLGCATIVASFVYGVILFFSSTGLPEDERKTLRSQLRDAFAPFATDGGYELPGVALCAAAS